MNRIGFDNDKYVKLQSQNIRDRIKQFGGNKLVNQAFVNYVDQKLKVLV